jgi:uncharacterized protein (TIGR02300 family)
VLLAPLKAFDTFCGLWQVARTHGKSSDVKGKPMPKEDWGVKRLCPETGKRFYDLNKTPIISPYTGKVVELSTSRSRTIVADAEDAETKKMKDVDVDADVLDEDDVDVDLGDDVLEDDDDDDDVSLDDIADVAADDDDS